MGRFWQEIEALDDFCGKKRALKLHRKSGSIFMDFGGLSQTREREPVNPEALARGKKLTNLQPCSFVAADSLICSVVALWLQLCYRLKLQLQRATEYLIFCSCSLVAFPAALARGYKLLDLRPCRFVAADYLICILVVFLIAILFLIL